MAMARLVSLLLAVLSAVLIGANGNPLTAAPPEIEQLIKQLRDKDEAVRLKAAKELGRLGAKAKDAIPALTAAVDDPDEDVRSIAKKSLAAIKQLDVKKAEPKLDEKFVPLVKDLKSKDNKVRLAAIAKLKAMGEDAKPAGAALVEFGMMSPVAAVRTAANDAFELIDPAVHKELVTISYDTDFAKRDRAVDRLAIMAGDAKSSIPIIKGYHAFLSTNDRYRLSPPFHTMKALVAIAPDDEGVRTLILQAVGGTFDEFLDPVSRYEFHGRGDVIKLMQFLEVEDKLKVNPLVSGLTQSRDAKLRTTIIKQLTELNVENKVKYTALMTALARNKSERAEIITEIGKLGADAKAALPTLRMLKTDGEEAVRIAADAAIKAITE